ncbi:hypothetical protein U1Q18_014516 [Sarracenia purpurea var. burkii]
MQVPPHLERPGNPYLYTESAETERGPHPPPQNAMRFYGFLVRGFSSSRFGTSMFTLGLPYDCRVLLRRRGVVLALGKNEEDEMRTRAFIT